MSEGSRLPGYLVERDDSNEDISAFEDSSTSSKKFMIDASRSCGCLVMQGWTGVASGCESSLCRSSLMDLIRKRICVTLSVGHNEFGIFSDGVSVSGAGGFAAESLLSA